jgi:hypothetical protein
MDTEKETPLNCRTASAIRTHADSSRKAQTMKQRLGGIGLALAALALFAHPVPALAAAPIRMPFKATTTTASDHFVIPLSTPLISARITGLGQADLLGTFKVVGHHFLHPDVSGSGGPEAITDGVQVFVTAAGDAIFITYSGLIRAGAAAGEITSEQVFTITGGQGRFVGATGGGVLSVDIKNTPTVEGQILSALKGVINIPQQ